MPAELAICTACKIVSVAGFCTLSALELQPLYFHDLWTCAGCEKNFYKQNKKSPLTLVVLHHLSLIEYTTSLYNLFNNVHSCVWGRGVLA
jgi:hypothetical protein